MKFLASSNDSFILYFKLANMTMYRHYISLLICVLSMSCF